MGYIAVDDVDRAAATLEQQGGKVHRPPTDVPGVIRFCVVADPQGAGFIIAKGLGDDAQPELPIGTQGSVGWRELYALEWKTAFEFYAKMFGWTKAEAIDMGPMGTYQLFATGDDPVGGMMTKPAAIPMPYGAITSTSRALTQRRRGSLAAGEASSTARCRCRAGSGSCNAWTRRALCLIWLP